MDILAKIIEEYIETARPVGSRALVARYKLKKSPATIRAQMNKLEKRGLLTHPHTSAGRMPTEEGYRLYIENSLKGKGKIVLSEFPPRKGEPWETWMKNLVKKMAEATHSSVIIAFGPQDTYYTGLSFLFSQPEFRDLDFISIVSQVVDHLDERMKKVFEKAELGVKILLGNQCPFGRDLSAIVGAGTLHGDKILIILLGPIRMDYKKNFAIMRHALSIISGKDVQR